jgi:hypothetical protein
MPQGRAKWYRVAFLAAVLTVFVAGAIAHSHATPLSSPSPQAGGFKYEKGWLGADDAYSIPLGDGRSLWVFGDTFIADKEGAARSASSYFIRNSIGITSCANGPCSIRYFWGQKDGKPDSMFSAPGNEKDWLWPMDGFVHDGTLYIGMMDMHAEGTGAFGFDFTGILLASIANYTAPPEQWKVTYQELNKGAAALVGVSMVVGEGPGGNPDPSDPHGADYAHFFTLVQNKPSNSQHLSLTRLPLNSLNKAARPGSSAWQYLRSDSTWAAWPDTDTTLPKDSAVLLKPAATEMTVRYHDSTKQWIAVFPGAALEAHAMYSISDSLTRGWKAPKYLLDYPEMKPTNANYTKNVFCYAAKEHTEFEKPDQLMFTYACNSFQQQDLYDRPYIYRPMMVTVPLPK